MRDFWRHLKAAWLFGRSFPYIEQADAEESWTDKDASALFSFFETNSGKKLKLRLNNYCINKAREVVNQPNGHKYQIGVAAGLGMMTAALYSHAPEPQPEEQEETETELAFEG